ncbi:acetylglutamate kinase [Flavobacterium chuncheonense]|uniref:Acetylglutamate kinase n=1 Tax=Flavobacterium chuncheonense TaxID=2026653 RepID=A0ABW5YPA2_9FLAO
MKKLNIIKVGGNIIDDELKLAQFTKNLSLLEEPFILIHGGGKLATDLAEKLNIPQQLVDGRRITSADTLKIATMTYAGFINKNIVAQLQQYNVNSIGLSGADGNLILSKQRDKHPIDFGYVGDITKESINITLLKNLIDLQLTPIICAITHDKKGQLLNTNADEIANTVACSLSESFDVELIYCFEKNGVLLNPEDDNSVIEQLNEVAFLSLKEKGIINKGMLPKLENCFNALKEGVTQVGIINASNIVNFITKSTSNGTQIK